nr:bifunctional diaminohydroxyphosphoribosylaminopyrimidine deaminase/5-amino-6-(5-phosphoribosylamino)uracil reductase RibD [Bacteroidales bacterium]
VTTLGILKAILRRGKTYPNPLVGAVIVHRGKICGEGYHLKAGTAHAEVVAIALVADKTILPESTLYVSLEPCSHYGKTPPCADLIISSGIRRVVIGTVDTNEKVSGRGIAKLREAGCEVTAGVLEDECRHINRRFFTFHEKKRPWIILKWAQSADGFLDTDRSPDNEGRPVWISGKPERALVHRWRSEEQAILVGAGTVRADNPRLNVRDWAGRDPLRCILSSSGDVPPGSAVFSGEGDVILFTHLSVGEKGRIIQLEPHRSSAVQVSEYLFTSGIQSLFVEGGASVLNHFISEGLWDEMRVFTGKDCFRSGIMAPRVEGTAVSVEAFAGSTLSIYMRQI